MRGRHAKRVMFRFRLAESCSDAYGIMLSCRWQHIAANAARARTCTNMVWVFMQWSEIYNMFCGGKMICNIRVLSFM